MNWHDAIGILSTLALFTPVFIIVVTKLIRYKQYLSLFYLLCVSIWFQPDDRAFGKCAKKRRTFYGITNNLTDMPLMLGFLIFQIPSSVQKKE